MKPTMNLQSALGTAVLRSAYQAVGSGAAVFLITWASVDELKAPLIAGGIAALAALGFRGIGEGAWDQRRANTGNVKASDVVAKP